MRRVIRFFREDLWERDLRRARWWVRGSWSALRVLAYLWVQYDRHLIGIRASGLALFTLLGVVPILAVGFAIAEGFGYGEKLDEVIRETVEDLPENLALAFERIRTTVDATSFQALGLVSSLFLVWTGMSLFVRVEEALNYAWRTTTRRAWLKRATSFLSLTVVAPLLVLGALVVDSALRSGPIVAWLDADLPWLRPLYDAGLWLVPHVMMWLAFTGLYRLMPSTPVRWVPALIAGVCAGSGMLLVHGAYVYFQIGVARASAIYAALAALPLLLVYLQTVWTVVLLGAELGYAVQNLHLIGPGRDVASMPPALRERIAFALVERACARYTRAEGPLDLGECATEFDLPIEWLTAVADDLVRGEVLLEARGGRYVPARPPLHLDAASARRAVLGDVPPALADRLPLPRGLEAALSADGEDAESLLARVRFGAAPR